MAKSKQSKVKATSPETGTTGKTAKRSSDDIWNDMMSMGFENGHLSDRSGGGIVICGIGPPPPTRKRRIAEFTRHLKLMTRRAKDGDCYIIFDVKGKRRKSGSPNRFLQFWFGPESFYADLPKTTFDPGEADSLVSSRPGFYFRSTRRVAEDQKDYVEEFNPVFRDYKYGEEGIAADDMGHILFTLWTLPVAQSVEVTAARAGE